MLFSESSWLGGYALHVKRSLLSIQNTRNLMAPFLWKLAALDHFVLNLSQRKNASINIITSAMSNKNSIIFHRQLLVPLIISKQGCHSKNPLLDSNAQNWHLPLPSFHLEKVWSLLTDGKGKPRCSHTSCGSQFWEFRRAKTTCQNWLKTDRHNEFETCR